MDVKSEVTIGDLLKVQEHLIKENLDLRVRLEALIETLDGFNVIDIEVLSETEDMIRDQIETEMFGEAIPGDGK